MEKFIKKLSMMFVTFLCVTYLQAAYASDITSVIDYPKQNDMSDKFHQSSLMARCAGVVGAFAKFLPQSPASMKTVKENLFNHSMNMLTVSAMLLAEKKQTSQERALQQVMKAFDTYVAHNYKQIEDEQIATGSIMEGAKAAEMQFCVAIAKNL